MSDSELENMPLASWYDEETTFYVTSSYNLESSLGIKVDSPSVNNQTTALEVDGNNVAVSALSTSNYLGDVQDRSLLLLLLSTMR